jgi:hypothetical protein
MRCEGQETFFQKAQSGRFKRNILESFIRLTESWGKFVNA